MSHGASEEESQPSKAEKIRSTTFLVLQREEFVTLRKWPNAPKVVDSSWYIKVADAAFDAFLFACSTTFLAFALVVHYSHGLYTTTTVHDRALEPTPRMNLLLSATKYGPTVFPILFASVVGRLTHTTLCWRITRGERMGVLDSLASSTSLTSTVTSQVQMRILSYVGLILMAIWALSPVGGQASVRLMSTTSGEFTSPLKDPMTYTVPYGNFDVYTHPNSSRRIGAVNVHFANAILSYGANKTVAPNYYGSSFRIPTLEFSEAHSSEYDEKEGWHRYGIKDDLWHDLDWSTWSSMVTPKTLGPIWEFKAADITRYFFNVQMPYLTVNCSSTGSKARLDGAELALPPDVIRFLGTGAYVWYANSTLTSRSGVKPQDLIPFKFFYTPLYTMSPKISTIGCEVKYAYTESEVRCILFGKPSGCSVQRVRRSRLDHLPAAWTYLDTHQDFWPLLLGNMIASTEGTSGAPSLLDRYLTDPLSLDLENTELSATGNNQTTAEFSIRMGQLLNTYWNIMQSRAPISQDSQGFIPSEEPSFIPPWNSATGRYGSMANASQVGMWKTPGTVVVETQMIVAHKAWVATLATISVLLIIASLVSPTIRTFLPHSPDLMMNVSSLARSNQYLKLPNNGTFLTASERARLLKDVKVKFGDAEPEGGVGRLVIASVQDEDESNIAAFDKNRLYE